MQDSRELLIMVSALCGVLMVAGAFGLLYQGIIKLDPPSNAKATELDLFKVLRLKTNIGAVVLFALGLLFLMLGFQNIAPDRPQFHVRGLVSGLGTGEHVSVAVCGGPWPVPVLSNGSINHQIKPDLDSYMVQIGRIGVNPMERTIGVVTKKSRQSGYGYVPVGDDSVAQLGEIKLEATAVRLQAPSPVDHVKGVPPPSVQYGGE